jgi:hypothetical protein
MIRLLMGKKIWGTTKSEAVTSNRGLSTSDTASAIQPQVVVRESSLGQLGLQVQVDDLVRSMGKKMEQETHAWPLVIVE